MTTAKRIRPYTLGLPDLFIKETGFGHVPSASVRNSVKLGYFVKLVFEVDPPQNGAVRERLWVEVTKNAGSIMFTGIIRSSPAFLKEIMPGEHVTFGPENICDVSLPTAKT